MEKLVLYGIGDARDNYRALRYFFMPEHFATVHGIKGAAFNMTDICPSVKAIYLMDNRPGLREEFNKSLRAKSFEDCVIFKLTLEKEGIRIL